MPQHIKRKSGTRKHKHINPVKHGALIRHWCKWGFCKMIDLAAQRAIAGAQPVPEAFPPPFLSFLAACFLFCSCSLGGLILLKGPPVEPVWYHIKPISRLSHRDIDTWMWEPSEIKGLAGKLTHFEENTQRTKNTRFFWRSTLCFDSNCLVACQAFFLLLFDSLFKRPSDSGHVSHGKRDFGRAEMGG